MKKAILRKCFGEAHGNPYIDHCGVCMPFWGVLACCPECLAGPFGEFAGSTAKSVREIENVTGSTEPAVLTLSATRKTAQCRFCHQRFAVPDGTERARYSRGEAI